MVFFGCVKRALFTITVALGGTFVRLFGKDSSGLYVLNVGEEHIGNLVDRSGLYVK